MTDSRKAVTFAEVFDLPLSLDARTTARAFGVSRTTIYRRIRDGALPVPVLRLGRRYAVPTVAVLQALGIELSPVDPDDVLDGVGLAVPPPNPEDNETED